MLQHLQSVTPPVVLFFALTLPSPQLWERFRHSLISPVYICFDRTMTCSLQVTIKTNLSAELKHQTPNRISNSSDRGLPRDMFGSRSSGITLVEFRSLQVIINTNTFAELRQQAPNQISNSSDRNYPVTCFLSKPSGITLGKLHLLQVTVKTKLSAELKQHVSNDVFSHSPAIYWSTPRMHIPTTFCLLSTDLPMVVRLCQNVNQLTT